MNEPKILNPKFNPDDWPPGYSPTNLDGDSFLETLANATNSRKKELVSSLIASIQSGKVDATVWRIIEKALVDSKPKDDKNKPIPILGGITQTHEKETITN